MSSGPFLPAESKQCRGNAGDAAARRPVDYCACCAVAVTAAHAAALPATAHRRPDIDRGVRLA
jgi:hypothetical protein